MFRIFERHSHVKTHGYEIYKGKQLLIDKCFYKEQEIRIKEHCCHVAREHGDRLIVLYENGKMEYLPRFINEEELESLKKLTKKYFSPKRAVRSMT